MGSVALQTGSGTVIYAILALLFLLSAACAGNGSSSPTPADSAPAGLVLTPPPAPPRLPTNTPATLPPTPTPSLSPPPPLPPLAPNQRIPYVQLTAGKHHACGLRADGIAHCWGDNAHGKTNVPARMRFQQISAGLHFTCGLHYAGAVTCWGDNLHGQTDPPPGLFTQIAAGRQHVCALDAAGKVVCWGDATPWYAHVEDLVLSTIGSGEEYSCGLTMAGDLNCWGKFDSARAGPFTALAAGLNHHCVLRPDGTAACYGDNGQRQATPPATAFAEIAAGWHHSCGITRADGVLECWGAGQPGQAGQRLAAPAGVFAGLSSGWRHNCALRPDGAAQCWQQPSLDPTAPRPAVLTPAFGGRRFDLPVALFPWPAGGIAVVDRAGAIRAYYDDDDDNNDDGGSGSDSDGNGNGNSNGRAPRPILDLTDQVDTFGERGMLSAALDPDFDQFPFLYVYYHRKAGTDDRPDDRPDNRAVGRLSRFPVRDGAAVRAAELVILTLPDLEFLHHGGAIRFGPDGMLYLGIGDNFKAENAPDLASRHGKIIRIDVRGATPAQPYRIPDDNPFADTPGARPEIWAYGLRNPWRMDFDAAGRLWVADVGLNSEEEVSIATAGANLGWPVFEGNHCRSAAAACAALRATATATAPVTAYTHQEGKAIIGGIANPQPEIAYIFGDYASRRIWALERDATAATGWQRREIARASGNILSFGRGPAGAVFVLLLNHPILRLEW